MVLVLLVLVLLVLLRLVLLLLLLPNLLPLETGGVDTTPPVVEQVGSCSRHAQPGEPDDLGAGGQLLPNVEQHLSKGEKKDKTWLLLWHRKNGGHTQQGRASRCSLR